MSLATDLCSLQFSKPLIPQSNLCTDYLSRQLLICTHVPATGPFNCHVNKQAVARLMAFKAEPDAGYREWPLSLEPHAYICKALLSSAHKGTTDSLLSRWGAGPSLLADCGTQVVVNGYGSHKTWVQFGAGCTMRSTCPLEPNGGQTAPS